MSIENNDIVIKQCPHCECICLISKTDIESSREANKLVCISCHQCQRQFAIDGEQTKYRKIARPANLKIITCLSCKNQVTVPYPLPDQSTVKLLCPFCNNEIGGDPHKADDECSQSASVTRGQKKTTLKPAKQVVTSNRSPTNYMPLYVLAILSIGAYLFWAFETGLLPIDLFPFDQWLKILQ